MQTTLDSLNTSDLQPATRKPRVLADGRNDDGFRRSLEEQRALQKKAHASAAEAGQDRPPHHGEATSTAAPAPADTNSEPPASANDSDTAPSEAVAAAAENAQQTSPEALAYSAVAPGENLQADAQMENSDAVTDADSAPEVDSAVAQGLVSSGQPQSTSQSTLQTATQPASQPVAPASVAPEDNDLSIALGPLRPSAESTPQPRNHLINAPLTDDIEAPATTKSDPVVASALDRLGSTKPEQGSLASGLSGQFQEVLKPLLKDGGLSLSGEQATQVQAPLATSHPATASALSMADVEQGRAAIPVTVRFGNSAWAGQVAERTAMMVAHKLNTAELQLDPPELGPLQVKVTIHHDQASVSFVSANPQVREALDQSANRLRELLGQQGVNLADVNVSDQSSQQHSGGEQPRSGRVAAGEGSIADPEPGEPAAPVNLWVSSGVDYYA